MEGLKSSWTRCTLLTGGVPAAAALGDIDVMLNSVPAGLGIGATEAERFGLMERALGTF